MEQWKARVGVTCTLFFVSFGDSNMDPLKSRHTAASLANNATQQQFTGRQFKGS
jgi:hypothetical protein